MYCQLVKLAFEALDALLGELALKLQNGSISLATYVAEHGALLELGGWSDAQLLSEIDRRWDVVAVPRRLPTC